MAQSKASWYFSTMARRSSAVETVEFWRTKYGAEMLVDVAWAHDMPTFLRERPHRLDFHDIFLVTKGRGRYVLDGWAHPVRPGAVFFTAPRQVRAWEVKEIDGLCLFFLAPFIDDFLNEAGFISGLPYFNTDYSRATLQLTGQTLPRIRQRLIDLQREFSDLHRDSDRVLKAGVCDVLVQLERAYGRRHPGGRLHTASRVIRAFREMVLERSKRDHRVGAYAARLNVSANHLNALCREHLGKSAKGVIADALAVEARRALIGSDRSVEAIGADLGFKDPSYFARFFKRMNGHSPSAFRDGRRSL